MRIAEQAKEIGRLQKALQSGKKEGNVRAGAKHALDEDFDSEEELLPSGRGAKLVKIEKVDMT